MRLSRFALASLLLAACSGEHTQLILGTPAAPVTKVDVNASASDVTLLLRTPSAARGERGGQTVNLDADVTNPQGHVLEHKRRTDWTSRDTLIATVDSAGVVTAQDTGDVFIVVDHKTVADSVFVRVRPVPVKSVYVSGPDSISVRDTVTFTAEPRDSDGVALLGRTIAWHSSDGLVLENIGNGVVVGLAEGAAQVIATSENALGSAPVRVWPAKVASVSVSPSAASLPQFRKLAFTAVARDRHGVVLTGRAISWSSSAPALLQLFGAASDSGRARDVGNSVVTASVDGVNGTSAVTVTNPVEARALWVTRFEYTTGTSVDFNKISTIFQKAASANFNVVYFQVRTAGDAIYYSDLEPCSPRMCGTLGGPRPSRDPLAVALSEAARYGIQVHAWINANTGWIAGSTTACNQLIAGTPMNWLKAHPEWSVSTKNFTTGVITRTAELCPTQSEYVYMSPGVPEVRAQVARVSADLARRYGPLGLRGIHLDRIRYPSNQVSYDPPSQDAFKAATGAFPSSNAQASWLNFRRGFVNQEVRDVRDSVATVNPAMVISAAVWPGYVPRAGWSATWSYTDLFQDPQAWAQGGYLDVEVPMDYPATASSTSWTVKAYCSNTDWTCVMDDHVQRIERQSGRQVYVGVGAIKGWNEMAAQLDLAHDRAITGVSVYSFSLVDAIPNGWGQLAAGPFRNPATIPAMPWK